MKKVLYNQLPTILSMKKVKSPQAGLNIKGVLNTFELENRIRLELCKRKIRAHWPTIQVMECVMLALNDNDIPLPHDLRTIFCIYQFRKFKPVVSEVRNLQLPLKNLLKIDFIGKENKKYTPFYGIIDIPSIQPSVYLTMEQEELTSLVKTIWNLKDRSLGFSDPDHSLLISMKLYKLSKCIRSIATILPDSFRPILDELSREAHRLLLAYHSIYQNKENLDRMVLNKYWWDFKGNWVRFTQDVARHISEGA